MEDLAHRPDPVQVRLRECLRRIIGRALAEVRLDRPDLEIQDLGSGFALYFSAAVSPARIVAGFAPAIADGLAEHHRLHTAGHHFRLCLALHHGLVLRDASGWAGSARHLAHRLARGAGPRPASQPGMSLVVSDAFYRTVVRSGYRGVEPRDYRPTRIALDATVQTQVWVHQSRETPSC